MLLDFKLAQKLRPYYHQMLHGVSLFLMSFFPEVLFLCMNAKFGSWIQIQGSP